MAARWNTVSTEPVSRSQSASAEAQPALADVADHHLEPVPPGVGQLLRRGAHALLDQHRQPRVVGPSSSFRASRRPMNPGNPVISPCSKPFAHRPISLSSSASLTNSSARSLLSRRTLVTDHSRTRAGSPSPPVQRLQAGVLDLVPALDLARDQLRVVDHVDLRGTQLTRQLQAQQHGLVLGDVVGGLADVGAALGQLLPGAVGGHGGHRGRARVAARAAIHVDGHAIQAAFSRTGDRWAGTCP